MDSVLSYNSEGFSKKVQIPFGNLFHCKDRSFISYVHVCDEMTNLMKNLNMQQIINAVNFQDQRNISKCSSLYYMAADRK